MKYTREELIEAYIQDLLVDSAPCRFCGRVEQDCTRYGMTDYIEHDIQAHDFTPDIQAHDFTPWWQGTWIIVRLLLVLLALGYTLKYLGAGP